MFCHIFLFISGCLISSNQASRENAIAVPSNINSLLKGLEAYLVNNYRADFNDYADKAYKINVAILKKINELKIDFAYPTQTLNIVNQDNEKLK